MSAVPVKNVYNMLVYAFEVLKSKEYERLGREDCEDIYDLLASLLLCGMNSLIKRGFLKNYVGHTEELNTIRGRLDMGQSIRKLSLQNTKAVCNFDEFNANIYFNQVLKTTFLYLQRRPLQKNIKRDVSKILLFFNEIDAINISAIKWDNFVFNRNNAHYDILLYFCRLICEEAIANQSKGRKDFRTIEDNLLPSLFERFVYAFYKRHLPLPYRVLFQHKIEWKADKRDMLPEMRADTIIESDSQKLIIDTKFYSKTLQNNRFSDNQTVISNNLYQIFAYVKNEAGKTSDKSVSGMLLYPQVDLALSKAYSIDGHYFYIRTVDLNQEFGAIKQEMMDIHALTEQLRIQLQPKF
jgi:5-methylcytosine-specific restriction enzyme subunit McrC